jgi:hypothetical protein
MLKLARAWGWKTRVVLRVGTMLALAVASAKSSLSWTIIAFGFYWPAWLIWIPSGPACRQTMIGI